MILIFNIPFSKPMKILPTWTRFNCYITNITTQTMDKEVRVKNGLSNGIVEKIEF